MLLGRICEGASMVGSVAQEDRVMLPLHDRPFRMARCQEPVQGLPCCWREDLFLPWRML